MYSSTLQIIKWDEKTFFSHSTVASEVTHQTLSVRSKARGLRRQNKRYRSQSTMVGGWGGVGWGLTMPTHLTEHDMPCFPWGFQCPAVTMLFNIVNQYLGVPFAPLEMKSSMATSQTVNYSLQLFHQPMTLALQLSNWYPTILSKL